MAALSLRPVILLATYNGARYIEPFLDSLEVQTRQDFQLLVRDDGSSDGTLDAILARQSRLDIEVMPSSQRAGAARSFMELLQFAGNGHAAYLFADQDDIWLPEKVEQAVRALAERAPAPALYCTRQQLVDADLKPLGLSATPRFLDAYNAAVENVVTGCTMGINAALRDLVLQDGLPSGYRMHDAWMYLVASALGQVIHDPWPSVLYRQHGNNTVGATHSRWQAIRASVRRVLAWDGDAAPYSGPVRALLQQHGHRLDAELRQDLELLKDADCSAYQRIRLCLFSRFRRQRRIDHVIMRILFLLGRF